MHVMHSDQCGQIDTDTEIQLLPRSEFFFYVDSLL